MNTLQKIRTTINGILGIKNTHKHKWESRFYAGANNKTGEVCSCECGKYAVKDYGSEEYKILSDNHKLVIYYCT